VDALLLPLRIVSKAAFQLPKKAQTNRVFQGFLNRDGLNSPAVENGKTIISKKLL
jgi:hypothetical protein